jgi:hypothetical protein
MRRYVFTMKKPIFLWYDIDMKGFKNTVMIHLNSTKKLLNNCVICDILTESWLKIKPGQTVCSKCLNEFKLKQNTGIISQEDEHKDFVEKVQFLQDLF